MQPTVKFSLLALFVFMIGYCVWLYPTKHDWFAIVFFSFCALATALKRE
jgi:hypothetical protein